MSFDFKQKPIRKSTLVRLSRNGKRWNVYEVNIGMYNECYAIWCRWVSEYSDPLIETANRQALGRSEGKKQLKLITQEPIKALVQFHKLIQKYIVKGYVRCSIPS